MVGGSGSAALRYITIRIFKKVKEMIKTSLNLFIMNVCVLLTFIALWGVSVERKTLIIILMSVEILYLTVGMTFMNGAALYDDFYGQFVALCILLQAAAESALSFAVLISYYRYSGSIELNFISILKG